MPSCRKLLRRFYSESNVIGVIVFMTFAVIWLSIIAFFDHTRLVFRIPGTIVDMFLWLVVLPIVIESSKDVSKEEDKCSK
jgi:hypothetical protein